MDLVKRVIVIINMDDVEKQKAIVGYQPVFTEY